MKILAIAPHPDDETLGCGGTLLKHKNNGDEINWLIITDINSEEGWPKDRIKKRSNEIKQISNFYNFSNHENLSYPSTKMDIIPISELIEKISKFYNKIKPEVVYMPYDHDVHTDHQIICKAVLSMIKWFRYPYINKVLMYETLSETDFNLGQQNSFKPNTYVDISNYIDKKIKAMSIYESEIESFPFPRSKEAIKSLAMLRGSQSGFNFAESFVSIYEKIK